MRLVSRRTVLTGLIATGLVAVLLYLGIALINTSQDNESLRENLGSTTAQLDATTNDLGETREELRDTTRTLEATTRTLKATSEDLDATDKRLDEAQDALASEKSQLKTTTKELRDTTDDLQATSLDLSRTSQELDATKQTLEDTTEELALTSTQLADTSHELDSTAAALEETTRDLETTTENLNSTTATLDITTTELEDANAELDSMKQELAFTTDELTSTTAQLDTVTQDLSALRSRVGNLETVETRLTELEAMIEQRTPLIPDTHVGGFACTGSMEPTITCMDTALWLDNYDPNDIVVGAVISFNPDQSCNLRGSGRTAHRVIEIRSAPLAFKTKGDANDEDDECWIAPGQVNGYITAIYKGTVLENAVLMLTVGTSKVVYREAEQEYEAYVARYCPNYECSSRGTYQKATRLYNEVIALEETYLCWLDVAREHTRGDVFNPDACT